MKTRLRRHASISASKLTIREPLRWPVRLLFAAIALAIAAAMAVSGYDLGRNLSAHPAVAKTEAPAPAAPPPPAAAFAQAASADRDAEVAMLRSTQAELLSQVRKLEADNARLKEDLEFFESVLPARTGSRGVAIQRLQAELVSPGQLRYRLLVIQGGRGRQGFSGTLQLTLNGVRDGRNAMINFPDKASSDTDRFRLQFEHYQRVEGVVALPDGMTVRSVQVRVFEKGQVRAQQSVNL